MPEANELICPGCRAEITKQNQSDVYGGSPVILEATVPDSVIKTIKDAIADANPDVIVETEVIGVPPEVPEPVIPITVQEPEPVIPEIKVVEEALIELDKGEEALIVKEELIAPAAPKPEEKPDAPS